MSEPGVLMFCARCTVPMFRRPDGLGWRRVCGCPPGPYWSNLAPLSRDAHTFRELTGRDVRRTEERGPMPVLYRYGAPL